MKTVKLMTHIVCGYPNLSTSERLLELMSDIGVDYTELQIPFSDPVADGPTILNANTTALENGITPEDCFKLASKSNIQQKIIFMTYYNIIFKKGVSKFFAETKKANGWGVIVPDMPFDMDEHEGFYAAAAENGIEIIPVVSQLTTKQRLQKIAATQPSIVYCVSQFGTTGGQSSFDNLGKVLRKIKAQLPKTEIAVGFGIQTPEDVKSVVESGADIVVIGSIVIKQLENGGLESSVDLVRNLRAATKNT
jgi:tryptophan synthase alpha chain